jgi:hypothetical protein
VFDQEQLKVCIITHQASFAGVLAVSGRPGTAAAPTVAPLAGRGTRVIANSIRQVPRDPDAALMACG